MKMRSLFSLVILGAAFTIQGYAPGGDMERQERQAQLSTMHAAITATIIGTLALWQAAADELENLARAIAIMPSGNESTYLIRVFMRRAFELASTYYPRNQEGFIQNLSQVSPNAAVFFQRIFENPPRLRIASDREMPPGTPPFTVIEYLNFYRRTLAPVERRQGAPEEGARQARAIIPSVSKGKLAAAVTLGMLIESLRSLKRRYRSYLKEQNSLIKKYKLDTLTPLQKKVWLATKLASYRISWPLRYIIWNNPGSLSDLIGDDPHAIAELYYGYEPSQTEIDSFLQSYFSIPIAPAA